MQPGAVQGISSDGSADQDSGGLDSRGSLLGSYSALGISVGVHELVPGLGSYYRDLRRNAEQQKGCCVASGRGTRPVRGRVPLP